MAPQLLFLTLTVLAVAAVVVLDRFAGHLDEDDDEVVAPDVATDLTRPQHGLPSAVAPPS